MNSTADEDGSPVLDEEGHFHAADAPVDLSGYRWEDWITLAMFWLLALVVFYQFFTRYVLGDSASWTEEIARYLLIVVVFLGSTIGIRRNSHIHVEFVYRYFSPAFGRIVSTVVDVVRVAFLAYASWLSITLVPKMHNLKMTVIDVPMSIIYGAVAAGFLLMTWRALQKAIEHRRRGWSLLERPGEDEPA